MRSEREKTALVLAGVVLFVIQADAVVTRLPSIGPTPKINETVPEGYLAATDLFNALDLKWSWNPVLGRLELFLGPDQRVVLLVDSPMVGLGERLIRLENPVRFVAGRLIIPRGLVTEVLEPALGRPIRLPTPTAAPIIEQPDTSPSPALEPPLPPWVPTGPEIPSSGHVQQTPTSRPDAQYPIIVIDPGHGGDDQGSVGIGSTTEAQLVLRISQLCEQFIQSNFEIDVQLTRRDDQTLSTAERITFANSQGAGAFVSIHAGGLFDPNRNVPSVFFLVSPAVERVDRGGADTIRWWQEPTVQPRLTLWRLGSAAWSRESAELAANLHAALQAAYKPVSTVEFETRPRSARLAILRGLLMPAALVEIGSLLSLENEQLLHSDTFQHRLAEQIGLALGNWIYDRQGRSATRTLVP